MVWTLNPACFNSPMRPFREYRSELVPQNSIRNGCAFHWLLIDDRQSSTMLERLVEIGVYRVWLGEMVIHQTHVYRVTRRSGKVGVRVSGRRIGRRSGTGCPSDCSVSLNKGSIEGIRLSFDEVVLSPLKKQERESCFFQCGLKSMGPSK